MAAAPVAPGSGRLGRPRPSRVVAAAAAGEGPSCLYVGPIETASQEKLEALYRQARDSYYSGQPLIVDDMFDKVELKLRLYGSKSVVKYPRCSLIRQSTYADAEVTISQQQGNKPHLIPAPSTIRLVPSQFSCFPSTFGHRAGGPVNVYGVIKYLDVAARLW